MDQQDLIVCAFRYCLGRSTYIVGAMCNHLRDHWDEICKPLQNLIKKEIKDAIDRDVCGMEMDCKAWKELLEDINEAEVRLLSDRRDG